VEHSVSAWELALTVALFAASGGIGYASTVLLYDLLARQWRRPTDTRASDAAAAPVRRRRRPRRSPSA
jgi:hypothetical protein